MVSTVKGVTVTGKSLLFFVSVYNSCLLIDNIAKWLRALECDILCLSPDFAALSPEVGHVTSLIFN